MAMEQPEDQYEEDADAEQLKATRAGEYLP
jgi:hypothetical protein